MRPIAVTKVFNATEKGQGSYIEIACEVEGGAPVKLKFPAASLVEALEGVAIKHDPPGRRRPHAPYQASSVIVEKGEDWTAILALTTAGGVQQVWSIGQSQSARIGAFLSQMHGDFQTWLDGQKLR
jgi:hypothetical protein